MLNATSISIVFFVLGVMLGSLFPGFIGDLALQYRRVGFSLKLLRGLLRSLVLFSVLTVTSLLLIDSAFDVFNIPEEDDQIALGFGLFAGLMGASIVLFYGFWSARRRTNY